MSHVNFPSSGSSVPAVSVSVKSFGAAGDCRQVSDAVLTSGSGVVTSATAAFTASDVGRRMVARSIRSVTDAAITTGTAALTSATAAFTTADVGRAIAVAGAGTSNGTLTTTISAYVSSTAVTLAANASTTVSGKPAVITAYVSALVASYQSATQVTLASNAPASATGALALIGTDDTSAVQAAVASVAAAGGGKVDFPAGGYMLSSYLSPGNGQEWSGAGAGATTLWPTAANVAAIGTTGLYSSGSPLTCFTLADMSIDGTYQAGPFNLATKGVFLQYLAQCTFRDLVIQNTIGTGLGIDFLTKGTSIRNVRAIGNGRINIGGAYGAGSSGIGIGTGQYTVENWTISDCYAYGNARYGVFWESQTGTRSKGGRCQGTYSEANGYGFGSSGQDGAEVYGCTAVGNTYSGFIIDTGTVGSPNAVPDQNITYGSCVSRENTQYGFTYRPASGTVAGVGNVTYSGCQAIANTSLGFNIEAIATQATVPSGFVHTGCLAYGNGASGFRVTSTAPVNGVSYANCIARNNGQISGGSKYGWEVGSNVTGYTMTGCRAYDDGTTQKQAYGLYVSSGVTIDSATVKGNNLRGNLTGAWSQNGSFTNSLLEGNLGIDMIQYASGNYYFCDGSFSPGTVSTLGVGTLRLSPILIPNPITVSRLAAEITGAGDVGSKLRLGIYRDNGTGMPGTLVVDAGTIAGDSVAVQELTISTYLDAGIYWIGGAVQVVTTTQPTIRVPGNYNAPINFPASTTLPGAGASFACYTQTGVTAALPATFTSSGAGTLPPRTIFKVA